MNNIIQGIERRIIDPSSWEAVRSCEIVLWREIGQPILKYLHQRGLRGETIRHSSVALSQGIKFGSHWIPHGIVIPGVVSGEVFYLKIRRIKSIRHKCTRCKNEVQEPTCPNCQADNRYTGVRGNRTTHCGLDDLRDGKSVLLCEGEFDRMIPSQEVGNRICPLTLGSNTGDIAPFIEILQGLDYVLVVLDEDGKSHSLTAKILSTLLNAKRVRLPILKLQDKDISDFVQSRGDLNRLLYLWLPQFTPDKQVKESWEVVPIHSPFPTGYVAWVDLRTETKRIRKATPNELQKAPFFNPHA